MRSQFPFRSTRRGNSGIAPILNTPTISGTVKYANVLTASAPSYATTGIPAPVVTYQWQSSNDGSTGWTNLSTGADDGTGSTTSTYTVGANQYNLYLRVQETATNSKGANTASSAATIQVVGQAPVMSTPTLSGTIKEGQTVGYNTLSYSTRGVPAPTITQQWQYSTDNVTGWTSISSATGLSFIIDTTYAGNFLRCNITATNTYGLDNKLTTGTRIDTLYFGDGSDGDVTLSSGTDITSAKKYRNVTISAVTRIAALIQVCATLTGSGSPSFHTNGVNGTGGPTGDGSANLTGGAGGAGGNLGGAGGKGGDFGSSGFTYGSGQNGTAAAASVTSDGDGGNGVAGNSPSTGGTGASGTASSNPSTKTHIRDNTSSWSGGGGGGGGGAYSFAFKTTTYNSGSGGGGGGGFTRVLALALSGTGKFQANGGIGLGSGSTTGSSGSGGGGRVAVGTYAASLGSWTMEAFSGDSVNGSTTGATAATVGNTYSDLGAGD